MEADPDQTGLYRVQLNPAACAAFSSFMEQTRPNRGTRLRTPGAQVPIVFDPALQPKCRPRPEIADITHPIVAFARSITADANSTSEPIAAITVPAEATDAPPGIYVFATDYWRFNGIRRDIRLQTHVMSVPERNQLDLNTSDKLIDYASRYGYRIDLLAYPDQKNALFEEFANCEDELENRFIVARSEFRAENYRRVEQARMLIIDRSASRLSKLKEKLELHRRSEHKYNRRAAQMTQGKIKNHEADRDHRLARIEATADPETRRRPIAGGVIIVEDAKNGLCG